MVLPLQLAGRAVDPGWLEVILERTGMREHIDRHPHQLSGGQQQRVALCRALMARPEVIFADEPTGALDTRTGQEILSLLRSAVTMRVCNDGASEGPVAWGTGLAGIHERCREFQGEMSAGPTPRGGFALTCRMRVV
ncbi:hypothetical protein GCM10028793_47500 [Nocardiopsis oceani]